MQPVKEKFNEEWLTQDNKIYINKLNNICETYEQTEFDVS